MKLSPCFAAFMLLLPYSANAFLTPKNADGVQRRTIAVDRLPASLDDKDLMDDVDGLAKAVDTYNKEKMVDDSQKKVVRVISRSFSKKRI